MRLTRREMLASGASAGAVLSSCGSAAASVISPEQFGARGDGVTNDTVAFAAMSAYVNSCGGGTIALRPVTYVVGRQRRRPGAYAFEPDPIMLFSGCRAPLVIRGNGARLRCAGSLRYGTFEPTSGAPTRHPLPYVRGGELATPYKAMIWIESCRGTVEISDLELDGNVQNLVIGGPYGDVGWQIPASGIQLVDNSGQERLVRVHSHHHPLDGIIVNGLDRPRASRSSVESVRCDYNGRQGCSIVGGRGYDFTDCRFTDTGRSVVSSAPGAGVDIEAEGGKTVRDLSFTRCQFSGNTGCGLVADSGPSELASFDDCNFIGTTNWAAWPNKPGFRFDRCKFVGAIVHAYGDRDPERACQFRNCLFRDDPRLSPNGKVYLGENPSHPIADLPSNPNVLFEDCNFELTAGAVLPWTTNVVIFRDCTMTQRAPAASYPRGTFIGGNVIQGNAVLYSAKIRGNVLLNGRILARTQQ